jgi:hypothetical protein
VLSLAFDLHGDGPDEPEELAADGTDDLLRRLSSPSERDIASVQSMLRFPCELSDRVTDCSLPLL